MTQKDEWTLKREIDYIFDSYPNKIRMFEMVKNFIDKRYVAIDVVRSCETFYCHDNKFGKMYKCLSQCKDCEKEDLKQ